MLLGGAEFLGLGAAFMFPADAQPEREVPHTHGGSPRHPLSSLPGGRAPPEVFRENRLTRESPRAFRRGGFSLESFAKNGGVAVKAHSASVCFSPAGKLKMTNSDAGLPN